MKGGTLVLLRDAVARPPAMPGTAVVDFATLRGRVLRGEILRDLFRYREVRALTYRVALMSKPLNTAILLRVLSHGTCLLEDDGGTQERIGLGAVARLARGALRDLAARKGMLRAATAEIAVLESGAGSPAPPDAAANPVYLRTDLVFGLRAGGSVGHIAGVLNNLDRFFEKPIFLTSDLIPTVRQDIETHVVVPDGRFRDFNELPAIAFNLGYEQRALQLLGDRKPAFVYQRYSTYNYAGTKFARAAGVPFVLEYNGSEIWIHRNWGRPLGHEDLARRIELLNLRAADVVVVVSRPMRDELVTRGIEADKILVNPNGVDPERYAPDVDCSAVRAKHRLAGKTVIGFIGTFGRWHGAEVLVEAFGLLLAQRPELRESVRLLMIGDGNTMPVVRATIGRLGLGALVTLTGGVPQGQGPAHLGACDILASPHVPNPDGTPFFGSPTKLFEYMAMGKGIVASDLDQIGEVLRHGQTAWMVRPGDPGHLAAGLLTLIDDEGLRARLGRAAREEAVAHHTWAEHTRRIVGKLGERFAASSPAGRARALRGAKP